MLSPLLFSIFINDIPTRYIKNRCYSLLFADDLVTYFIFDKYNYIEKKINYYIRQIEEWLSLWRLNMAPEKCNYIVLSSTKRNLTNKLRLEMFKKRISGSDNICFLGIRFDHCLSFKNQIEFIKTNCTQRLNCLKILAHKSWKLSIDTLKKIYFALVRSVLDYSSLIVPVISKTNLKKLQSVQNCAIKIIYKLNYRESTQANHQVSGIKMFKDRAMELNGNYVSESMKNQNPLVEDLVKEYKNFSKSRKLKFKTILCNQNLA